MVRVDCEKVPLALRTMVVLKYTKVMQDLSIYKKGGMRDLESQTQKKVGFRLRGSGAQA